MWNYKFNPAKIKEIRELHSMTQAEAAERAGVNQQQWARWENGESSPTADSLCKIFYAVKVYYSDIPEYFLEDNQ